MTRLFSTLTLALALSAAACGGDTSSGVTFGGAQDIGQFRAILDDGEIPDSTTLDANGFFNEHRLDLPAADCGEILCAHGMLALGQSFLDEDTGQTLFGLALNTPLTIAQIAKPPMDVAVVLDTSGSMAGDDKVRYAKEGLHDLIDALRPEDRLAIVTYNTAVAVVAPLDYLPADTTGLHALVDGIEASGATNLYAGLEEGFLQLLAQAEQGRAARVLLLSDGIPSVGITSAAAISEMAYGFVLDGVGLTTIGVGAEAQGALLEELAKLGGGNYYFLEDIGAIREVFVEELQYFQSIIATDVQIEIRFNEPYGVSRAYGWDYEFDRYLNAVRVRIPTIALASRTGAEDEGRRGGGSTLFVELWPDPYLAGDFDPALVAEVSLTFRPADAEAVVEQTLSVKSPHAPGVFPAGGHFSHQAMEKGFAVFNLYKGLFAAASAATWNYHYALWLLVALEDAAAAWNATADDADISADLVLVAQFARNLSDKGADADEYDPDPVYTDCFGCAIGRSGPDTGLALLGLLALALRRRTRPALRTCTRRRS